MMKLHILAALALLLSLTACIDDDFTTSSSDVLAFSTDTVAFDTVVTAQSTATKQFVVYNHSKKQVNIESIRVAGADAHARFYLNVDGTKGSEFHNIEIRGEDSIYVFVEAFIDDLDKNTPTRVNGQIEFVTNGVTQTVTLDAWGQDVTRLNGLLLDHDTHLTADRPYVVYDSLYVLPGVTLTADPGTTLMFHDGAFLTVLGKTRFLGTADKPVTLKGDRLDKVVAQISFDIMSGQWEGVFMDQGSTGNEWQHVDMHSSSWGLIIDSDDNTKQTLHMLNCVLHNSSSYVCVVNNAWVDAEGTEFSDASNSVVQLQGTSQCHLVNCTLANYYLFNASNDAVLSLKGDDDHLTGMNVRIDNSIIYGNSSADISPGDLSGTNVLLRYCLLKSNGTDDAWFQNCKWDGAPKFYTVREDYIFDYRLQNESDAIGIGNLTLCPQSARYDRYGQDRFARGALDLGAYVWVPAAPEPATQSTRHHPIWLPDNRPF